jgi:hypothetical protein
MIVNILTHIIDNVIYFEIVFLILILNKTTKTRF